jgi:hypothetical protein
MKTLLIFYILVSHSTLFWPAIESYQNKNLNTSQSISDTCVPNYSSFKIIASFDKEAYLLKDTIQISVDIFNRCSKMFLISTLSQVYLWKDVFFENEEGQLISAGITSGEPIYFALNESLKDTLLRILPFEKISLKFKVPATFSGEIYGRVNCIFKGKWIEGTKINRVCLFSNSIHCRIKEKP